MEPLVIFTGARDEVIFCRAKQTSENATLRVFRSNGLFEQKNVHERFYQLHGSDPWMLLHPFFTIRT